MPNHVTTVLQITDLGGEDLASIQARILNDGRQIDFNKIEPMPECLADFFPHKGILYRAKAALGLLVAPQKEPSDLEGLTDSLALHNALRAIATPADASDMPMVVRAIQNYGECGYLYWYDWSNDHWGTKWNAYGQPDDGFDEDARTFEFQTAWAHPDDLIQRLSSNLRGVTFEVRYADEDMGSNCGSYSISNGARFAEMIAPPRIDQTESQKIHFKAFAFGLLHPGEDRRAHGYDENWEYSDELYDEFNAAYKRSENPDERAHTRSCTLGR